MDFSKIWNADYFESQYKLWKTEPGTVSQDWRFFFEGFDLAHPETAGAVEIRDEKFILKQSQVEALVHRYRDLGHLLACLDPLSTCPTEHPLLNPSEFNLTAEDLDIPFLIPSFFSDRPIPLREIIQKLKMTYCHSIGIEYMHLQDPTERSWLQERLESDSDRPGLNKSTKIRILKKLSRAALFESFLHKKFVGQTRFSLEGADALIPMLDNLVEYMATNGCREIILGMAHRGRLNVLTHILKKPYEEIYDEFNSCYDPESLVGAGDVKYHNGYLADIQTTDGRPIRIFMVNNPSHLESVNPVVAGFVRARQDITADSRRSRVIPLLIHGDAAFAGQGIVAETLNLSQLEGYRTGGTIHIVINNQIGYTTLPEHARSTRYSTDIAKMLMVPIFHVHGEDPEAVLQVVRLACDYRLSFAKDVVIDLVCYRRFGHNEGDDPYFTQPLMYEQIRERPSLHQLYAQKLIAEDVIPPNQAEEIDQAVTRQLEKAFQLAQEGACPLPLNRFYENWEDFDGAYSHEPLRTGVTKNKLVALARKLNTVPSTFSIHPKLTRLLERRFKNINDGKGIDWAGAEALAFASLLTEGVPIRLSGQDSGRGTFSQRHSVLVDTRTGESFIPLNHLGKNQAKFAVHDSLLSESGVLGFEYGYSLAQPHGLTLWEAQFGDFANNAQAIIDLYITSGESKWQRLSGLTLLLPHGYEGQGPEHSSARLERFLQQCAEENLQVCNPTTPAQYFHLLRRQAKKNIRKPLVVMAPKSLLRHPLAVSNIEDFTNGFFLEVCDDSQAPPKPKKGLVCSGKIFYDIFRKRATVSNPDSVVLRLEQLYPFPKEQLKRKLKKYKKIDKWVWVQEEPENMGAWNFVRPRLKALIGKPIEYVGRKASASTATGYRNISQKEQDTIVETALVS